MILLVEIFPDRVEPYKLFPYIGLVITIWEISICRRIPRLLGGTSKQALSHGKFFILGKQTDEYINHTKDDPISLYELEPYFYSENFILYPFCFFKEGFCYITRPQTSARGLPRVEIAFDYLISKKFVSKKYIKRE